MPLVFLCSVDAIVGCGSCVRVCQIFPYRDKGNKNLKNLMNTYKYINGMNNINNDEKVSNRDKWGK